MDRKGNVDETVDRSSTRWRHGVSDQHDVWQSSGLVGILVPAQDAALCHFLTEYKECITHAHHPSPGHLSHERWHHSCSCAIRVSRHQRWDQRIHFTYPTGNQRSGTTVLRIHERISRKRSRVSALSGRTSLCANQLHSVRQQGQHHLHCGEKPSV